MPYQYNPHSHVKIWLSNNPDVFMNFENQTRLIKMRENNPDDIIHLIYDSTLLNEKARAELHEYCRENNIRAVDADRFREQLQSDDERALYDFYKDEITHLKEGGNLGVASDILRWLSASYRLGSYTDLDVPLNTKGFSKTVSVDAPLLLNIGSIKLIGAQELVLALNEYIAVVDEAAAKKQIEKVHAGILRKLSHYSSDYMQKIEEQFGQGNFVNRILMGYMGNREESVYLKKSNVLRAPNSIDTSRNLRAYVNEVMSDKEKYINFKKESDLDNEQSVIKRLRQDLEQHQTIHKWLFFRKKYNEIQNVLSQDDDKFVSYMMKKERSLFLKSIVLCTTGPMEVGNSLFGNYVMHAKDVNTKVRPLAFSHYQLHKGFLSSNVVPFGQDPIGMLIYLSADEGQLNDSSWLEEGMNLQEIRQQKLLRIQQELKENLPSTLLASKERISHHVKTLQDQSKGWLSFWGRSRRDAKIKALQAVLGCFDSDSEVFDIARFKEVLAGVDLTNKEVFAGFFTRRTEHLIQDLMQLCRNAVVYRIAKDKKVSFHAEEGPSLSSAATTLKGLITNRPLVPEPLPMPAPIPDEVYRTQAPIAAAGSHRFLVEAQHVFREEVPQSHTPNTLVA